MFLLKNKSCKESLLMFEMTTFYMIVHRLIRNSYSSLRPWYDQIFYAKPLLYLRSYIWWRRRPGFTADRRCRSYSSRQTRRAFYNCLFCFFSAIIPRISAPLFHQDMAIHQFSWWHKSSYVPPNVIVEYLLGLRANAFALHPDTIGCHLPLRRKPRVRPRRPAALSGQTSPEGEISGEISVEISGEICLSEFFSLRVQPGNCIVVELLENVTATKSTEVQHYSASLFIKATRQSCIFAIQFFFANAMSFGTSYSTLPWKKMFFWHHDHSNGIEYSEAQWSATNGTWSSRSGPGCCSESGTWEGMPAESHIVFVFALFLSTRNPNHGRVGGCQLVAHPEKGGEGFESSPMGNAAWPMGVTNVGIHERAAEESIFCGKVPGAGRRRFKRVWVLFPILAQLLCGGHVARGEVVGFQM